MGVCCGHYSSFLRLTFFNYQRKICQLRDASLICRYIQLHVSAFLTSSSVVTAAKAMSISYLVLLFFSLKKMIKGYLSNLSLAEMKWLGILCQTYGRKYWEPKLNDNISTNCSPAICKHRYFPNWIILLPQNHGTKIFSIKLVGVSILSAKTTGSRCSSVISFNSDIFDITKWQRAAFRCWSTKNCSICWYPFSLGWNFNQCSCSFLNFLLKPRSAAYITTSTHFSAAGFVFGLLNWRDVILISGWFAENCFQIDSNVRESTICRQPLSCFVPAL